MNRFPSGDAPSFRKPWERGGEFRPSFGSKPTFRKSGFKKPWERGGEDRPRFDRDERPRFDRDRGDRPSFGSKPAFRKSGFKKPWERAGEDQPRFDRDERPRFDREDRPRFDRDRGDRPAFGAKKSFRDTGFKKPWERGGEDRPRFDREDRPRFDREDRPRFDREDRPRFDRGERPFAPKKPRTAPIPAEGELVFGRQPVREILRAARRPVSLVVLADGVKESDEISEIKALAAERGVKVEFFRREDLEAWVNGANHQGVVAFCEEYPYAELDEIVDALAAAEGPATVVVLDHVQDPQNLGSILRTCECAGVLGVVLPVDRAAAVTPAAVRASAGAAEHMKIARISNLVVALERFKGVGAWITGLEAVEGAKPCTEVDFRGKACLVVGSEAHGLCSPVRNACDFLARLPLRGKVNSLNAGVAAGLAIYEALRQQGAYADPANFPVVAPPAPGEAPADGEDPDAPGTPNVPEEPHAPEESHAPETPEP